MALIPAGDDSFASNGSLAREISTLKATVVDHAEKVPEFSAECMSYKDRNQESGAAWLLAKKSESFLYLL